MRDVIFDLPPGWVGDPLAVARCTRQAFEGAALACAPPPRSASLIANIPGIGEVGCPHLQPLPPPGVPGPIRLLRWRTSPPCQRLGASTEEGYGGTAPTPPTCRWKRPRSTATSGASRPIPATTNVRTGRLRAAWQEGCLSPANPKEPSSPCRRPAGEPLEGDRRRRLQTRPRPLRLAKRAKRATPAATRRPCGGCDSVPFAPKIASQTSSRSAETGTGLDFELQLPNEGLTNPGGVAETEPQKMEVALPEGVTANPSAAEGLGTCSEAQYDSEQIDTAPGEGCPEASKVGSIVAHSPLLNEPVEGSLYLATPYANKTGTLLGLYLVARAQERGVLIKQALKDRTRPQDGPAHHHPGRPAAAALLRREAALPRRRPLAARHPTLLRHLHHHGEALPVLGPRARPTRRPPPSDRTRRRRRRLPLGRPALPPRL